MSHPLYELLFDLESSGIHFTLGRHRDDSVLVTLTLVGERVEIDVFDDGRMEVSRFLGSEEVIGDIGVVKQILAQNRD